MTDHSIAVSAPVAVAALDSSVPDETNFSITDSMVSFLRMEANQADARAKRLRKQASEIAHQFGITEHSQRSYGTYYMSCENAQTSIEFCSSLENLTLDCLFFFRNHD